MIKRIYDISGISISEDYYYGKIRSYMEAYGGQQKFVSFYTERGSLASGNLMMLNSGMVVSKGFADKAELSEFIMMYAPETVECPMSVSEKLKISGYEKHHRTLFRVFIPRDKNFLGSGKPAAADNDSQMDDPVSLDQMFMILNQCFSGLKYDVWYADVSHRVRHGISSVYTYKECACASIDFRCGQSAYISSVAVMPAVRRQGYGSVIMNHIADELKKERLQGYLWADDKSAEFYRHIGYAPVDEDYVFHRKSR